MLAAINGLNSRHEEHDITDLETVDECMSVIVDAINDAKK